MMKNMYMGAHNVMEIISLCQGYATNTLCKNIQCPGGTIAGHNNQQVPNPGMPISTIAQSNLKLVTFWIMHHLECVQCPTTPLDVTHAAINPFVWQQKLKDTYKLPTEPLKIDEKNWVKTMEAMKE